MTKLLEEFERKQRLERELRMQQRQANLENNELLFKSGGAPKDSKLLDT